MTEDSWLYFTGRFLFYLLFKVLWRAQVFGHENIPRTGGVIIASNHKSFFDPPLVGSAMKRPLYFMAKKELFDIPILGFLIRRTNAFPVTRGEGDIGSFRTALKLLKKGKAVLVFPEGHRSSAEEFLPAKAGAGMMACVAGVPVVPARINTGKMGSFRRIKVVFGKPIAPQEKTDKDAYQKLSDNILEEIKKLEI
jgi:1-acyl-sn-glycerol-3-phosphate acyltransferase